MQMLIVKTAFQKCTVWYGMVAPKGVPYEAKCGVFLTHFWPLSQVLIESPGDLLKYDIADDLE